MTKLIEFFPISPRFFSDERLYKLDCEHKLIFAYAYFGLQSAASGKTGIHRVGRGEISTGANVDIEKTCEILDYFTQNNPELLCYDEINHVIYLPSKLKYLLRSGYTKPGSYLMLDIHKEFKKIEHKAVSFLEDFASRYEKEIDASFAAISKKDNNYSALAETYAKLKNLKPKNFVEKFSTISTDLLKTC